MATFQTTGIEVSRQPSQESLKQLGVYDWAIWSKDVSEFPWIYGERETCYLLEGDVIVTPDGGEPVRFGKGDLVTFPAGLSYTWKILQNVKKHYRFG